MDPLTLVKIKEAVIAVLRESLPDSGDERIEVKYGNWHETAGRVVIVGTVNREYEPARLYAGSSMVRYDQAISVILTCLSGTGYPSPEAADASVDDIVERVLTVLFRGSGTGQSALETALDGIESVVLDSVNSLTDWSEMTTDRSSGLNITFTINAVAQ